MHELTLENLIAPFQRRSARTLGLFVLGLTLALFGEGGVRASSLRGAISPSLVLPAGIPAWSLSPGARPPSPAPFPRRLFSIPVTVTGYSSTSDQTDTTPFVTASNTRVRTGVIALSRDLLREFTPGAPFGYGDQVELEGVGVFTVEDTMNPRFAKRVDIWFSSRAAARLWGRRSVVISKLSPEALADGRFSHPSTLPVFEAALAD